MESMSYILCFNFITTLLKRRLYILTFVAFFAGCLKKTDFIIRIISGFTADTAVSILKESAANAGGCLPALL